MKKILSLSLAILITTQIVSAGQTPIEHFDLSQWMRIPSKTTLIAAALILGFGKLYTTHPVEDPEYKGSFKEIINLKLLLNDPKCYGKNIKDLLFSYCIGQPYKSGSIKLGADGDDRLKISKDCPSSGLLGHIDAYVLKTCDKALKSIASLAVVYHLLNKHGVIGLVNNKQEPAKPPKTHLTTSSPI